jgi:hypothetical protein
MILEGIVTTIDDSGAPHAAPMGPLVEPEMRRFVLRPYRQSRTYQNLKRHSEGVFQVTDDVELLARAAVDQFAAPLEFTEAKGIRGYHLTDCCRWYAFRVASLFDEEERTTIDCIVVARGRVRDFIGFNRAKHAVLEAAILATRIEFLPPAEIWAEMHRLAVIVEKTAGDQERRAFDFLHEYLSARLPA